MIRLSTVCATLAATALAAGVCAAPAGAKITFTGVAGVDLGMTEAELREDLGEPSSVREAPDGRSSEHVYRRRKLEVVVFQDQVVRVETTSRAQRTSSGLRVGSSQAQVRRKLRGENCGQARGTRVCSVDRNGYVMHFRSRHDRVFAIGISPA